MSDWPGPDDWLLRVDALALVRVALSGSEDEAASYLLDFACDRTPHEWKCTPRIVKIFRPPPAAATKQPEGAVRERPRYPPIPEIFDAIRTRFWRIAREFTDNVFLDGNRADYTGWLFLAPVSGEIKLPEGPSLRFTGHMTLVGVHGWRATLRLSAIRFRATPLVAALRDDGARVDAAVAFLRSRERLPRPPSPEIEPGFETTEKAWLAGELEDHPPGRSRKSQWATAAAKRSGREAAAIQTLLSKYHPIWIAAGGKETPPTLRRRRGRR